MADEFHVEHDPQRQRFVIRLADGEAFLSYTPSGKTWDFYHVFVPPSQRGKGLAAIVVKAALEYARQQSLRVAATCPYVQQFLARHREYQDLLAGT